MFGWDGAGVYAPRGGRPVTRATSRRPSSPNVRASRRIRLMPPRALDDSKRYDAAYYARWYHDPRTRVTARTAVRRKAALAVAATESLLERPVRNVLDVGCGEAPWRAALLALRPRLRYTGVEPSEWAARRWGTSRGVVHGGLGDLGAAGRPPWRTPSPSRSLRLEASRRSANQAASDPQQSDVSRPRDWGLLSAEGWGAGPVGRAAPAARLEHAAQGGG